MPYETGPAVDHGLNFRFEDLPDFRGDSHWQYLQLNTYHPSQETPIGYLRVAFVSRAMGEAMNRERMLLVQTRGHSVYPHPADASERRAIYQNPEAWDDWKTQPRAAARYVMDSVMRCPYTQWNENLKQMSDAQLVDWVEEHRVYLNQATQPLLDKMFEFAVNKADVDYIDLEEQWRGKGIGRSLYQAMAEFLDEHHGITLNASTTQSPSAIRCWDRMRADGLVETDEAGRAFYSGGVSAATLANRPVVPDPVPQPTAKRRCGPRAR